MAKTTDRKRGIANSTGAAFAAMMLVSPGHSAPAPAQETGQVPAAREKHGPDWSKPGPLKFAGEYRQKGEFTVAGVGDGQIVFEDERGRLFYVDAATGDQKFVTRKVFSKVEIDRAARPHHWIKLVNKVTILGVNDGGKLIMANSKGEKFHLDAATGDMIFVK